MDVLTNVLTTEQQKLLSTILMEYFNAGDWKELFEQTGCEEFTQQHTEFYEDVSWQSETIETTSAEALAFILNKDSTHLKIIWMFPGVQTMVQRKNERFHTEIEALIEQPGNSSASPATGNSTNLTDKHQNPLELLDDAEKCLNSERTTDAYKLVHAALSVFWQQTCKNNEITADESDSISMLHARVNNHIKQKISLNQENTLQNDTSLSLLRTATLMIETIDDLELNTRDESQFNEADVRYALNVTRSVMAYIDQKLF